MSQSTGKILALLEVLQARPGLTGPQLAERLGVDERTVRRYAAGLADLGLPVRAGRGRYGGYSLAPGYRLPPLMLGDDEAVAVVLGLLAAARLGLGVGVAARESALAKIERVLPPALRERVRAVRETLGFTGPAREPAAAFDARHLLTIGEAARDRRRVRLAYRSWRGEETERAFDPYGVVFHAGRWYTTGLDHRSGEHRTLRLDRIGAAVATDERFEPPPQEFDPVGHVVDALAAVPYHHEVEVRLRATPEEVRRRVPPAAGAVRPGDAEGWGATLTCRAERLDGMAQMLAGLGWDFDVVRPDALRAEVAALGRRLIAAADTVAP
ncbi:helix-turn-helix transcriptional regulator [Dactylosporangium sp. CA-139066]|uniref:helix-turn-helix transcriptional regulator n=1 Tax=Dactylosporangium sp. CA-139066 TaxID=3239930 RepID=UPI003D8D9907